MSTDGEVPKTNLDPTILDLAYKQNDILNQQAEVREQEQLLDAEESKMLQALSGPDAPVGDDLIQQYDKIISYYSDSRRVLLLEEALRLRDRIQAGESIIPTTSDLEVDTIIQPAGDNPTVAEPIIDDELTLRWLVRTNHHPDGIIVTDKTAIGSAAVAYLDAKVNTSRAGFDASVWRQP